MVNTNQTHSASGDNVGQDKNTFNQTGKIGIGENKGIISGNAKVAGQYNEAPKVNVNVHVNVGEGNNNNGKCDQPTITKTSTVLEKVEAYLILTGTLSADNPIELEKQKREITAIIKHLNKKYNLDLSIEDITQGSIKVRLSGSEKDINKLRELCKSGELQHILDIPVEDVYVLMDNLLPRMRHIAIVAKTHPQKSRERQKYLGQLISEIRPLDDFTSSRRETHESLNNETMSLSEQIVQVIQEDLEGLFEEKKMKSNPKVNFRWLVLKRIEGYSWEEIAQEVNVKVSAISNFYQRSLENFKPKIKEYLEK